MGWTLDPQLHSTHSCIAPTKTIAIAWDLGALMPSKGSRLKRKGGRRRQRPVGRAPPLRRWWRWYSIQYLPFPIPREAWKMGTISRRSMSGSGALKYKPETHTEPQRPTKMGSVSLPPGLPYMRRSLAGYSPWGCRVGHD